MDLNIDILDRVIKNDGNVPRDIKGNIIDIGDVVAVAYQSTLNIGIVEKIAKTIRVRSFDAIEGGSLSQIGRGITGNQCLILQKEFVKEADELKKIEKPRPKLKKLVAVIGNINDPANAFWMLIPVVCEGLVSDVQNTLATIRQKLWTNVFLVMDKDGVYRTQEQVKKLDDIKFIGYRTSFSRIENLCFKYDIELQQLKCAVTQPYFKGLNYYANHCLINSSHKNYHDSHVKHVYIGSTAGDISAEIAIFKNTVNILKDFVNS